MWRCSAPVVRVSSPLPSIATRALHHRQVPSLSPFSPLNLQSLARNATSSVWHQSPFVTVSPQIGFRSFSSFTSFIPQFRALLARTPRGFGNFDRKGGDDEKPSDTKQSKKEPKEEEAEEEKDENESKSEKGNKKADNNFQFPFGSDGGGPSWITFGIIGLAIMWYLSSFENESTGQSDLSFQQFKSNYLSRGMVEKITVNITERVATAYLRPGSQATGDDSTLSSSTTSQGQQRVSFNFGSVDSFERNMQDAQRELGWTPSQAVPIIYSRSPSSLTLELVKLLPTFVILGLLFYSFRALRGGLGSLGSSGGPFSVGKAKPTVVGKESKIKTRFKDVAGLDEAKVEIMEFVKFLQNPSKFTRLGAKLPKGALLVGPPGTGKTLLARAVAGEAGVPFFSMSGSDFMEMFVGVGASRVRDLFKQARAAAPCIVFIDEIDAVGRKRGQGRFSGGHDEREATLNQLLVEMDGFKTDTNIVILAGTNRADILDPALMRPGRFDRQITIDKPDIRGRRQIFEVHLKNLKLQNSAEEIAQRMSSLTPGFSGADIANVCNEAALIAARNNKSQIELVDFEAAVDRVIGGLEKKNKVMSPEERKTVAYHEAGHAVAGWFFEHADPLLKVTIVPRGSGALGFAQYLPQELNLYREVQIVDKICMALGGRVAEQLFFKHISTGAADDLRKVTQMAYSLVQVYGMNEHVGHLSFPPEEGQFTKPFSEKTAALIDEEASKLVVKAYNRTLALLEEKKELVSQLAERLLVEETINHDVIVSILGARPFASFAYDQYVKHAGTKVWGTDDDLPGKKAADENKADEPAPEPSDTPTPQPAST